MQLITIQEAIDKIDLLKANTIPAQQKKLWLNELDKKIWYEIYMTHEGTPPAGSFRGYDQDTEPGTLLQIPEPHTEIYQHWLAAQIDLVTAESGKYAQDRALYNAAYQAFADAWRRTHMPRTRRKYISF